MARREERDSRGERFHSRSGREPSPKKARRDGKPATERTYHSRNFHGDKTSDRDEKGGRRWQDAGPLDKPISTETKLLTDVENRGSEAKEDGFYDRTRHSADFREVPRPKSYSQLGEQSSAGQGGRKYVRRATDHGRWSDQKEQSGHRVKDKTEEQDLQRKDERPQYHADDNTVGRPDGEVEAPPVRRRPAFREKKMPIEPESDLKASSCDQHVFGAARKEERGDYNSCRVDKPERPFKNTDERNNKREEGFARRSEVRKTDHQSRDRFPRRGMWGRDSFDGRYSERNNYRQAGVQLDKWKHDLFDEANRSPTSKNEEEQIAKVEALLSG
ncbi:uncharacterized protein [Typha angustifolia]|uniref:uncharacterized protein n=1 Tax=Typha angustifolia TaxID=59011 RepID=UPI003C2FA3B9